MVAARLNPALTTLRSQINNAFPNRPKQSDGWLGDAAHAARRSQHNKDPDGSVDALDITNGGSVFNLDNLLAELIASGDRRLRNVIRNYRIWQRGVGWSAYGGPSGHTHHAHVDTEERFEWDPQPWRIPMLGYGPTPPIYLPYPDLTKPEKINQGDDMALLFVQREGGPKGARPGTPSGVYTLNGNIMTGVQGIPALEYLQNLCILAGQSRESVQPFALRADVFDSLKILQE